MQNGREHKNGHGDEKIPPHSLEHEMCVLGACLLDKGCIPFVADVLKPSDFYQGDHAAIYRVILDLFAAEKPVDLVTVPEELRKRKKLADLGPVDCKGKEYIYRLADGVPSAANAEHYAQTVADKSKLRQLIAACGEVAARAFDGTEEASDILDDASARILKVSAGMAVDDVAFIGDVAMNVAVATGKLARDGGKPGVPLGFHDLDGTLGGGFPGEFMVIGARPSVGKSALSANIALSMAMRGLTCLYVSLEMENEQIARRVLAGRIGIEQSRIRAATVTQDDVNRMIEQAKQLQDAKTPWMLYRARRFTIERLRLLARRMKSVEGLDVLVVDYLQLLRTEDKKLSIYERVTECSGALKDLAGELECLVIAPCQINRDTEKENREPRLSDLRSSGDIEQDADVVILMHEPFANARTIELIVAKARSGPRNVKVPLDWSPALCLFSTHAEGNVQGDLLEEQADARGARLGRKPKQDAGF